jgi:signal transduction histidine kinase
MNRVLRLTLILAAALTAQSGRGQQSGNWRVYGMADGLPELACRFVSVGGAGDLLVRGLNSPAITAYDGYSWAQLTPTNSVSLSVTGRVFQSPAGQLWMGCADGLCQLSNNLWVVHRLPEMAAQRGNGFDVPLCPIRQNEVLVLFPQQLIDFAAEKAETASVRTLRSIKQTRLGRFTGLSVAPDDSLWITGERGLAQIPGPKRTINDKTEWREFVCPAEFRAGRLTEPRCGDDGSVTCLWKGAVGTNAAILHFDGHEWTSLPAPAGVRFAWEGPEQTLWAATTDSLMRVVDGKLVADDELAPGTIYDVAVGLHGMFWLGTSEGLFCRIPRIWRGNAQPPPNLFSGAPHNESPRLPPDATPHDIVASIEMPEGKTWCATRERIWAFNGQNWATVRSMVGRINAMIRAPDGVWVASSHGVHHFTQGNWVDMGTEEGLGSASVRDVQADAGGHIWAATARGIAVYEPDADLDPPRVEVRMPPAAGRNVPQGGSMTISFSGHDKWNVTPASRLLYSWRLDDLEWSPFDSATSAMFAELAPGKHYFQVRAMDRNGNIDLHTARLEFAVVLPWYRETRSMWIGAIGGGAALFFAALAFKRHRDLVHAYAQVERQVAERTRELQLANEELLQSQKMKALGTLAAGIAHDFNNILSIVKGSAQIIEENPGDTNKIRARTDRIKTVVEQGSAVVQALLGFSRTSDELPAPGDINEVVENTIRLFGDRFLREVTVRFDRSVGLPEARVAKTLVQQILLNFVFNAAESMSGSKEVIITTSETTELPPGIALSPARASGYVLVSVRDFGCGISAETMPRIFEPFFTTKAMSARRGTGLGLSVAYELARKMQAGLAVQSTIGEGSVFTLVLPVVAAPAASPAKA